MAKSKLRIQDEPALRQELETLILASSQALLVEWSIDVAKRSLKKATLSELEIKTIDAAFQTALAKTKGEKKAYDVRVAGFAVHQLVDSVQDPIKISILRICGQAVGVAHMREHARSWPTMRSRRSTRNTRATWMRSQWNVHYRSNPFKPSSETKKKERTKKHVDGRAYFFVTVTSSKRTMHNSRTGSRRIVRPM